MTSYLAIIAHPAYLLACVLVALAGRRRRGGFFVFALLSLLLTPLSGLFILYVGGERRTAPDADKA
jgi:hypothetical protein